MQARIEREIEIYFYFELRIVHHWRAQMTSLVAFTIGVDITIDVDLLALTTDVDLLTSLGKFLIGIEESKTSFKTSKLV